MRDEGCVRDTTSLAFPLVFGDGVGDDSRTTSSATVRIVRWK